MSVQPIEGHRNFLATLLVCCATAGWALPAAGADGSVAAGLVLTQIHRAYEGDVRFPEINWADWKEIRREPHVAKSGIAFDFVWYERAG